MFRTLPGSWDMIEYYDNHGNKKNLEHTRQFLICVTNLQKKSYDNKNINVIFV